MIKPKGGRPSVWHWLFTGWVVAVFVVFFMQFRPYADVILDHFRGLLPGS